MIELDIYGLATLRAARLHYGIELTWLHVDPQFRGLGVGYAFMTELCAIADAEGQRVWTWAKPFRCQDPSPYRLVPFYAQFGFAPIRPETRPDYYRRVRLLRG